MTGRSERRHATSWLRGSTTDATLAALVAVLVGVRVPVHLDLGSLEHDLDRVVGIRVLRRPVANEVVGESAVGTDSCAEVVDRVVVPAGVHHSDVAEVEPERERHEPTEDAAVGRRSELDRVEERLVLVTVPGGVGPAPVRVVGIAGGERNGVELVIADDHPGSAVLDHRPRNRDRLELERSSVDQVADEDHLPSGLPVGAITLGIPELLQQGDQLVGTTVHVADDVVSRHRRSIANRRVGVACRHDFAGTLRHSSHPEVTKG